MNLRLNSILAAMLLLTAGAASAIPTNLGDLVTLDSSGGTLSNIIFAPPPAATNKTTAVVAGAEFEACIDGDAGCATSGLRVTIDISDSAVSFQFLGATTAAGSFAFVLSDLDWIPAATIAD